MSGYIFQRPPCACCGGCTCDLPSFDLDGVPEHLWAEKERRASQDVDEHRAACAAYSATGRCDCGDWT